MNLYFGNFVTMASTLLVLLGLCYFVYCIFNHKKVEYWGRKILVLALLGLVICCFVATRDGYHLSVQASFDKSVAPGIFTIYSIQSTLCCIGGAIIAFSSLSSIFVKNQKYRKIMFIILGSTMIVKTLIIEIARIIIG